MALFLLLQRRHPSPRYPPACEAIIVALPAQSLHSVLCHRPHEGVLEVQVLTVTALLRALLPNSSQSLKLMRLNDKEALAR